SRTGRAASVLTTTGRRDITVRRRVTHEVANRRSPGTVRRGDTSGRCCPVGQHENQENHNDHSAVFHRKLWGSDPGSAQGEGSEARFDLGIGTYTYRGVTEDQMVEDLKALKIQKIELSSPNYFLPSV